MTDAEIRAKAEKIANSEHGKAMAESWNQISAEQTYKTFCEAMDAMGWKYEKFEEDLVIRCGVNGEDLPMELIICVRKEPKIVGIYSRLPFKAADDKEIDMAVAVSMANYRLIHGNSFTRAWSSLRRPADILYIVPARPSMTTTISSLCSTRA